LSLSRSKPVLLPYPQCGVTPWSSYHLLAVVYAAPAASEVALDALHDPTKAIVAAVLARCVEDTRPVMPMLSEDGSWNEGCGSRRLDWSNRSNRKRPGKIILVPLWAGAGLPLSTTQVA
jgi:hypothetical protein